jgi:autotransporter translocation and assembly factor TamB
LNAHSTGINLEAMSLDSTNLTVDYHDSVAAFDVFVQLSDSLSVGTKGNVEISQNLYRVLVDSLNLRFLDQMWRKEGPPALISIDDSGYGFEPLTLHSRGQTIGISGLINDMGESDFAIDISDIKLSDYERWFGEEAGVDGTLFINFKLQGTFARPELECQIVAKQGTYYDVSFDTFDGTFGYADENFTWGFYLAKTQSDSALESSARLPMSLSLAPFATEIYADKEMEFKISTQGIEVAFLQQFFPGVKKVQGTLVADIVVRNTLNDMHGVGPIRIINGQLDIPEFGMKFRKANIVLLLREQELLISGFKVESGGGTFKVTEGSLSLSQGNVQNFSAKFRADNFRLINNKMMNARVSGDVGLSGSVQSPSFTGELTFTEANIFYEEWLEEATPVTLTSLPFFVITDEPVTTDSNGAIRFQKTAAQFEEEFTESALFKSLSGELALYFPRNVWVKGSDTNIEVEGELVAVKEVDSDIVLFGSFSVMRGYYEILGNPFHITEGELVFTGDPEHNPEVAFTATRKLVDREQGNNHELTVKIAGTLFYPEFEYRLDNQATSELEVAYILLWGKPLAEANQPTAGANGQPQEEGKLGLGKRATGFLEGQLLNQISNQLGQKLSLDVIEIKKGKSITEASVRVGKYITRDVYLSVGQDVDGGARTVEMEYDLPISKVKYLRFLSEYINLLLQTSVQDKSDEKDQGAFDILGKIEW